jgi:hypothetical protein
MAGGRRGGKRRELHGPRHPDEWAAERDTSWRARQDIGRERLPQHLLTRVQQSETLDVVLGIPRDEQDGHAVTALAQPLGELPAAHRRHREVGDHELEPTVRVHLADELERLGAVPRLEDIEPLLLEDPCDSPRTASSSSATTASGGPARARGTSAGSAVTGAAAIGASSTWRGR